MKKFTLFFTFLVTMLSTQAQEISTDQWTIVTKTSATWCTNCGGYGWDMFKNLIDDNADKNVIIWSSHNSGDLDNEASIDINNGWGSAGQPQFFVNSDEFGINLNNPDQSRAEINGYIDALVGFGALAGVGVDATYDGETLTVIGQTEFLSDLGDGDFHLAFYLLKDHVIANQANVGANADHRFVLSDKITDSTFGDQIVQGEVSSGATYTVEASKDIADVDLENDEVVAILWNLRVDGVYAFFNANRTSITESGTSSIEEISGISDISTRQSDSEIILSINTDQSIQNVETRLLNVSGQVINSQSLNASNAGSHEVRYNNHNLTTGTYLIQVTANGKVHTEKIIVL